jgi:hypothetical protein
MKVIEDSNFLSKFQKKHIENVILGNNFPFYYTYTNGPINDHPFLAHIILQRPEFRNYNDFNSTHHKFFIEIFKSFCDKNNIKYSKFFRIAVNLTFKLKQKKSEIHVDHSFEHKQLIIYLNDCDQSAKTILLKNNKIYKKIKPKKYKGVCFDKCKHYMLYPKTNARVVVVYTFI